MNLNLNSPLGARLGNRLAAAIAAVLIAGCASAQSPTAQAGHSASSPSSRPVPAAQTSMLEAATVDGAIPTPASVIGHEIGAQAVRYDKMERYLHALADASPLVTITEYARTHEGRPLYYLTVTSEANHRRLNEIKANNAKLADPRTLTGNAQSIIDATPAIAWMAYSIHGDELSGCDAAVLLAYHLAAGTDDTTRKLRDELVIHIDPLQNPDGRERYLAQLQTLQGRIPVYDYQAMQHSGLWAAGRGNHYLFDLNRDWLPQVHPETRGRTRVMHEWNPHLLVDAHEMGALSSFLFDPPREPFNPMESEQTRRWRKVFSGDQAAAFDRHGWSYYTQEWYEEWYPGYTNAWANLNGTIGLLYEQGGVANDGVKQDTGQLVTYRDAVQHQYVSSVANLNTLLRHRTEIVADFAADRKWCVSQDGPSNELFILPPAADRSRRDRFLDLLTQNGVEYSFADSAFDATGVTTVFREIQDTRSFPKGSVIVRSNQPHRRMMHAILDFDPRMTDAYVKWEREEIERRRGSLSYDVTAWNVAMSYGLEAFWAASIASVATVERDPVAPAKQPVADTAAYGYVIDGADGDCLVAAARLLQDGFKVRAASKPFKLGERLFPRGSLLLRGHENPPGLAAALRNVQLQTNAQVFAASTALTGDGWDLGGERFHLLHPPRVAIASQWPTSTTSFGSHWYGLDVRLGLRVSPVNIQDAGGLDLRAYNTLIIPDASNLDAVLSGGTLDSLRQWVEAGGTLICIGEAAAFAASDDAKLSDVRLRGDVLEKLEEYNENADREAAAHAVELDMTDVWGDPKPKDEGADSPAAADAAPPEAKEESGDAKPESEAEEVEKDEADKDEKPKDKDALKREDDWRSMFSPAGVFVRAIADEEHWLCFGLPRDLPVLCGGGAVLMSRHPVQTPVRMVESDRLRLAGLLWPEARLRMERSAFATVESMGSGQIILFANDPFFRAYTEGTGRMFFNAVILGPGMGASQPLPW